MLRIKEILKEKKLSQIDLAEKLEITTVGLNKIINGNPTAETLLKIAEALDVDVKELFISTKDQETTPIYIKEGAGFSEIGTINFEKFHIALNKG
ncbi:helix-turn-helix domain-containing protein [Epilithonimonas hungarica]|uniref:DNA-binding transcriptional regulator, XRE-family HTH domain n=1 Tax=Epilithonimonas hungarica TaxID=454006 RepID=A0A1G7F8T0_9FLAO|nr:helix-turn-helix transcriptional regulator [Epilithonimonas hungarica]SDE72281.1 DNA-binding transcriptional regulator, XRE-family HTH domain [Epilithonimonas hungarica]